MLKYEFILSNSVGRNEEFMNLFICQTIAIDCGYILDLLIGDPHWLYHPVRLIGNLISLLESILLKEKDTSAKKYRKYLFWLLVIILI